MIRRPVAIAALVALPLAACQPFQTISEDQEHVTYQFDPNKVMQDRVIEAAEDKCEYSPLGSRPAVLVSADEVGPMRQLSFVCKPPGEGLNIEPALDRTLSKIPVP